MIIMADNKNNKKNGVSIWFLYIGIFLCCSGIGVVVGAGVGVAVAPGIGVAVGPGVGVAVGRVTPGADP